MPRRRRRFSPMRFLGILVLGIGVGAAAFSVVQRMQTPAPPPPGDPDLSVEVLNGCGSPGAADRVATRLRRGGFRVDRVGNADHFHYREDIVIARKVSRRRAHDLGRWLGDVPVVEQRVTDFATDVTVIVGKPRPLLPGRSGS